MIHNEPAIAITPLYVLKELQRHTEQCTSRWRTLILTVVGGMAALNLQLFILLWQSHH